MDERKIAKYMRIAETVSELSHDDETKVGAILVSNKTGNLLMEGFNGFIRGADDGALPRTRPDKYQYMVHAEENLVASCTRHRVSLEDCIVFCTLSPCIKCCRLLWQAGITNVIIKEKYRDFETVRSSLDLSFSETLLTNGLISLTYHKR